jgi:hypothetical protein
VSEPSGFKQRVYDAFEPATPPAAGGQVVRQAQVVHTLTETAGEPAGAASRGWADYADPARARQAATAVVVSRAAVVVVLSTAAVAIVLAVLVRVLEWIA